MASPWPWVKWVVTTPNGVKQGWIQKYNSTNVEAETWMGNCIQYIYVWEIASFCFWRNLNAWTHLLVVYFLVFPLNVTTNYTSRNVTFGCIGDKWCFCRYSPLHQSITAMTFSMTFRITFELIAASSASLLLWCNVKSLPAFAIINI